MFRVLCLTLILATCVKSSVLHLEFDPNPTAIVIHGSKVITVTYTQPLSTPLNLKFNSTSQICFDPTEITLKDDLKEAVINITAKKLSSAVFLEVTDCNLVGNDSAACPFNKSLTFGVVQVVHSQILSYLVVVTGWIYVAAWSACFYPQILLIYEHKSAQGCHFDFLVLNVLGYACYLIYNVMMYFSEDMQNLYLESHPKSLIPVLLNDVLFSLHGLFICIFTLLQCLYYELHRRNRASKVSPEEHKKEMEAKQMPHHPVHDDGHLMSYTCMAFCSLIGIFVIITASLSMMGVFTWLRFIDNLALIKMIITACKYYPQAVHNYKRKSTLGWSIARVWLDFIGGSMSIAQMILQAVNTDDWSGFIGNKGKLGIGLLSVGFDIVFVVQHYLLYYHQKPIDEEEEETVEKGKKY